MQNRQCALSDKCSKQICEYVAGNSYATQFRPTMELKFLVPRVQVELGLVRDGTEAKNALGGTSSS